jgi:hypothetical protein
MKKRFLTPTVLITLVIIRTVRHAILYGEKRLVELVPVYIFIFICLLGDYLYSKHKSKSKLIYEKEFESKASNNSKPIASANNHKYKELKSQLIDEIGSKIYSGMSEYARVLINKGYDLEHIKNELIKYGLNQEHADKLLEIKYIEGQLNNNQS